MSLEQALVANTAALEALTAALAKSGGAATTSKASADKPAASKGKAKSAHSVEECQAILLKIKDDFDISHAKDVLKEFGIAKMAEIPADKADAVFAAATKKFEELSEGGSGDDDGI